MFSLSGDTTVTLVMRSSAECSELAPVCKSYVAAGVFSRNSCESKSLISRNSMGFAACNAEVMYFISLRFITNDLYTSAVIYSAKAFSLFSSIAFSRALPPESTVSSSIPDFIRACCAFSRAVLASSSCLSRKSSQAPTASCFDSAQRIPS